MNELNGIEEEGSIKRIREILKELIDNGLKRNKIADYLGLEKRQYWYFYKFIKGDPLPKYLETSTPKILERLKQLLEKRDLLNKETGTENDTIGYGIAIKSPFVWIPFDLKAPVADYNGTKPHLSVIKLGKKKGIVADRSTSKYDADGEIYIDHIGMATGIEPGMKLAIKRIDKRDWKIDRFYLIIDASDQKSIWELIPGDDSKTIKCISSAPEGYPMVLPLNRIAAIFAIVDGNCIPRPKRNSLTTSTTQQ